MRTYILAGVILASSFGLVSADELVTDTETVDRSSWKAEKKDEMIEKREEIVSERKEKVSEAKDQVSDIRSSARKEAMEYKNECKLKIDSASDEEKESIKEECKSGFSSIKDAYIEEISEKRSEFREKAANVIAEKMESRIDRINNLSEEKRVEFFAKLSDSLDAAEDKAIENENEDLLIIIVELRAYLEANK